MRALRVLLIAVTWLVGLPGAFVVAVAVGIRSSSGSVDNADWIPPSDWDLLAGGVFFLCAVLALVWLTVRLVHWDPR